MPTRIQLRRTKGWRMPAGAVKVDRSTRWGNPNPWKEYEIRERDVPYGVDRVEFARELAVEDFRRDLLDGSLPFSVEDVQRELRGRDLACWCPKHSACHADVLIQVANAVR